MELVFSKGHFESMVEGLGLGFKELGVESLRNGVPRIYRGYKGSLKRILGVFIRKYRGVLL